MFIRHIENFPIVQISYLVEDAVSVDETLEIFTHLLDKQQKFVFRGSTIGQRDAGRVRNRATPFLVGRNF